MADIQSLLDGVIETEIQNLGSLSSGSDEKSKAIQNLATLHKLRIEEIKAETEAEEKRERRVDRCVRTGVAVGELVLPLVFYGIWMNKGFKFEETGSFTSTTFKNLLNRFRPTK